VRKIRHFLAFLIKFSLPIVSLLFLLFSFFFFSHPPATPKRIIFLIIALFKINNQIFIWTKALFCFAAIKTLTQTHTLPISLSLSLSHFHSLGFCARQIINLIILSCFEFFITARRFSAFNYFLFFIYVNFIIFFASSFF
jgi:hypothetical protein